MKIILVVMLKIVFTIVTATDSMLTTRDYANLISDIHNSTNSSSVSLIHFTKEGNLMQKNLIFQIQVLLFKKNIPVSDINLRIISNLTDNRFHNFKGLRKDKYAMSVFILAYINDFDEMKKYIKLLRRTEVINFVIFMEHYGKIYTNICLNPIENPFGLSEGVSILVKCGKNVTIQEWHSINDTSIKIIPRATWEPKRSPRFNEISSKLLIGNRKTLMEKVLRTAIIKESKTIGEYFPKLIKAFEKVGNFQFNIIKEEEEHGIFYENNKTWSGAIELIINNEIDIALGWFSYLPEGLSVVDYTVTIDRAEYVILIKTPEIKVRVSWTGYFQPFTISAWLALLLFFIIIQMISVFFNNNSIIHFQETYDADSVFHICRILLHQDLPSISRVTPLRIFYISIIIFSFYIWSIYSAIFASKLTIIDTNVPFKTLEEFTRVKSHKMIVFQDTSNYYKIKKAQYSPLMEARELLVNDDQLPKTNEDAIEMVCNKGMALFTDDMFLAIAYNNSIPNICPMVTIGTNEFDSFALVLNKNSPFTSPINNYLRSFLNNGIMSRMKRILAESIPTYLKNESENKYKAVEFMDIVILLTILIASAFASVVILFFERLYFHFRRAKGPSINHVASLGVLKSV
ncbi:uncharacterized protein LOC127289379 [Leptopilina boulardi]|uniref:uncharacterized protein LOC127289379 n=1 Tax=Leptopilina boulardi TaxID=63433 RepID=UPI0021F52CBA|nr:uncharacterized protein LOC127289379 [Leptopilina boulardi]